MSILEKSERIGLELKKTVEGQHAYSLHKTILECPQVATSEFFHLINKYYLQVHFYSIQHVLNILEANRDNELLGSLIRSILEIEDVYSYAEANIPIGIFVNKTSEFVFGNKVKYELPRDLSFTPELVRLSNALTVECLRTNVLQRFLREYQTKPEFAAAIKRFGELRGDAPVIPYSKEDRKVLNKLKSEFGDSCEVDLIYSIASMISYIKGMIFDAFYDNVFEVVEETDVISRKQRRLKNCVYVRLLLNPSLIIVNSNLGWILKIHNLDGSIAYGQIFDKEIRLTNNEHQATISAIIFDLL